MEKDIRILPKDLIIKIDGIPFKLEKDCEVSSNSANWYLLYNAEKEQN